jgi:hypothetical protein
MATKNRPKCSICGQPIKTATGAITMTQAPLVCRRCFGQESYSGPTQWTQEFLARHASAEK